MLNSHWYKVADLKPILHSYVDIHRHEYRGLIWYLFENHSNGRSHRFNPSAYQFIGLLDGQRTIQQIYDQLNEHLKEHAPNQDEIIKLVGQLHSAELIQTKSKIVDTEELFERQSKYQKNKLYQKFSNPLSLKIPLWNPESFLNKHFNKVSFIFTPYAAIIWVVLVGYSILQASMHWNQITHHFDINGLSPYNLLLIFLIYPLIKLLHELGHAFSAKLEGGEVHEMGINFLVFMPIPYVDVSCSIHFRNKYKRILVSAAGIIVETFLASLGLLLFLATEPGFIQSLGFNLFVIGGISSLFFNGNPLLKFDGYYILIDSISIPNLYQRSGNYWIYLFKRYLFNLTNTENPANAKGERKWFIAYSLSSIVYRLYILWFISVYVMDKFFFVGVLLALWLVTMQLLWPLFKAIRFISQSPSLVNKRNQGILKISAIAACLIIVFGLIPMPSYTIAEGIVWLPDEAQLKAEQEGFAGIPNVHNNQHVAAGTRIIELSDPLLQTKIKVNRAKIRELQGQYRAKLTIQDLVEAEKIREAIKSAKAELKYFMNKQNSMRITAKKPGKILLPQASDLPGRYIKHGELIGYVLDDQAPTIRMAVTQENIGQFQQGVVDIDVKLASNSAKAYRGKIVRQTAEATNHLPSAALTTKGGGKIIVDPSKQSDLISLHKVFLIDLMLEPTQDEIPLGTRAYVRINHGGEAMATQWYRRIRQVFLRHINV